jgi:tRNA-specific 2-thiouridylase
MELAEKYKIDYPTPGGGCLLCEKNYVERLNDLFKRKKLRNIEPRDIDLLRVGRQLFFTSYKLIVGRNHDENLKLRALNEKRRDEKIFEYEKEPGPTVMIQGKIDKESIEKAKEMVKKYSKYIDKIVER